MNAPSIVQEITLSDLLQQVQSKLLEHRLLEKMMETNEQDLANIIARSEAQRRLIRLRTEELKELIDSLQLFADSSPVVH